MSALAQTFKALGYVIIPNFIDKEKVNLLRNIGESLLDQQNESTLKPTSLLKNPALSSVIFSEKFIRVLDALSQEYRFFLPNFTIRKHATGHFLKVVDR